MAIIDDVRSIIAKSLNIPVEQLTPDKRLDELGAESLDVIEIVFALEEKYDIAIPLQANDATRVSASGKREDKSEGCRTKAAAPNCRLPRSATSPRWSKNWSRRKHRNEPGRHHGHRSGHSDRQHP